VQAAALRSDRQANPTRNRRVDEQTEGIDQQHNETLLMFLNIMLLILLP